jgi:hypothetical protein
MLFRTEPGCAIFARGICLSVVAGVLGAKGQARAELPGTGQLLLEWSAPAECPSPTDVRGSVARLLGGKLDIPAGRTIEVKATVTQGQTWRVELAAGSDEQGHRRWLESPSCAGLAEATALIVALMIDPNAIAAGSQPAHPVAPPGTPANRNVHPMSFGIGVLGVAGLGILPGLDAGIGGSMALLHGAWRFDLRASYGLRRDRIVTVSSPPAAYGKFNYTGVVAGVCRNFARLWVDLGACADVEFGLVSAEGRNVTQESSATTPWFGLGPGGYLAIRAGRRISFPLRAALIVPITRPEFVISPAEQRVYRVAPLSGNVSLGAEFRF